MEINNKKARFDYFIEEEIECGIVLKGTEIKSIRAGKCNINDAYVIIKNGKVYILNMNIAKYDNGNIFNHEELRTRELLLHKHEINKLVSKVKLDGLTIVALRAYFKDALVKIEIGLAKGKKTEDKRQSIKERDTAREIQRDNKLKNRY